MLTPFTHPALAPTQVVADTATWEAAHAYALASKSAATRRAYATTWRHFVAWCANNQVTPLPCPPEHVALYLASLGKAGKSLSTIERAMAALAAAHQMAGHGWQGKHPALAAVLGGIRRECSRAVKKKTPLEDQALRDVVLGLEESIHGLRNRALLLLGWFGALRRSELVTLRVEDLSFVHEGLILRLPRSKTDQEGRGQEKGLPYASDPQMCPVRVLQKWLQASSIVQGPIFRSITTKGRIAERALSDQSVAQIVKESVRRAGFDPSRFAGHSLRAGFVTTAARKKKSLDAIMRQTGHRSVQVALGYIRHATLFDENAAIGLF